MEDGTNIMCLKRDDFRQRTAVYRVYKKTELNEENIGVFKKHHVLFVHLTVRSERLE